MNVGPAPGSWMDEIDLATDTMWLRMGTRRGTAPTWLLVDEHRDDELALRRSLIDTRREEVLYEPAAAAAPTRELLELVRMANGEMAAYDDHEERRSSLEQIGRSVQEDMCLLERHDSGEWLLAAAVVCFPSRWHLSAKVGRPLTEVHGPVAGYDTALRARVNSLLDRLSEQIVIRRNWFIHPDPALFQPERPADEPLVAAPDCAGRLFVRSERQTLRRLPDTGWIVFTIRTQQASIGAFIEDVDRLTMLRRYLADAPVDQVRHRGVSDGQAVELQKALDRHALD